MTGCSYDVQMQNKPTQCRLETEEGVVVGWGTKEEAVALVRETAESQKQIGLTSGTF